MARIARIVVPGIPHHVVQRGTRRMEVFFQDSDYKAYLEILKKQCEEHDVEIWSYCLMPNHIHLIAVPKNPESLSKAIGNTHWHYTRMINFREGWRGYLWQGRFSSYVMDSRHMLMAARYIELNPIRAKLSRKPWRYKWSSAKEHVEGESRSILNAEALLEETGDWQEFLSEGMPEEDIELLRKHARTGRPLGKESFIKRISKKLGRDLRKKKTGPKGPWKHKRVKV